MSLYPSPSAFTLKATISEPYKELRVFMYIRGGQITFWDETRCQHYPSVLMSHTRVVEGVCNPFCGVPTYCNLVRRVGSSIYKFLCVCPRGECTELILWFWPQSFAAKPRICTIRTFAV